MNSYPSHFISSNLQKSSIQFFIPSKIIYPFDTNTSTISIVFAESASSLITNYKKEKIHGIAPNSKNPRSGMQTESHVKSVIHVPFVNTFPLYIRSWGYT